MEAFQEEFHCGAALLLLAGGLIYTLMYCLSLVNYYVSQRYGSRPVVLAGAFGSCISLVIAAYSPNLALWVVAIGVGVGASLSCVYFTVFAVVGRCFRKYLGLANGISVAGVSVGQMAFPAMITYLNELYGARGATFVMAAVCLHLVVTAVLMPRYIVDPDDPTTFPKQKTEKQTKRKCHHLCRRREKQRLYRIDEREGMELAAAPHLSQQCMIDKKELESEELYSEMENEKSSHKVNNLSSEKTDQTHPLAPERAPSIQSMGTKRSHRLAQALLVVYIVAKIFGDIGDVSVSFIAPTHGTKLDITAITVSRAIALAGAVDLIARLGVGYLTDRPGCLGKRGVVMAVTWLVEGINAFAFGALKRFHSSETETANQTALVAGYFICFAVQGICSGTAMTQMVVVLSDWVGPSRLAHSLALTMVVLGVLISPGQFAIGYLADVTGDYVWPMRICALILLTGGILLLFEFPVRWFFSPSSSLRHSAEHQPMINGSAKVNGVEVKHIEDNESNNAACFSPRERWEVVNSDSDDEVKDVIESELRGVQAGVSPVPATLVLNSVDGPPVGALLGCAAEPNSSDSG
ncbi:unnamed protein product [Calicophoron daubneyi]